MRGLLKLFSILVAALAAIFGGIYLFYDHKNEPLCHKQTLLEVMNWLDGKHIDQLPNVEGHSVESLTMLNENDPVSKEWNTKYRYVPGLQKGDPGDLILMYMNEPTRYIFHNSPQTFTHEAKWMIVPLDFGGAALSIVSPAQQREIPDWGECSERVSLEEFKTRLRKTLQYLKDNNRPHSENAIAEHEDFLKSIAEHKR